MGVASAFFGALSGEVLDLGQNTVLTPSEVVAVLIEGGLEAVDESRNEIGRKIGILAEGAGIAVPPGIGGHIGLRGHGTGDTEGSEFLGQLLAPVQRGFNIHRCADHQVTRPAGRNVALDLSADLQRNAILVIGFQISLRLVDELSEGDGIVDGKRTAGGAHTGVQNIFNGIHGTGRVVRIVTIEKHERQLVFHRHLGDQVVCAGIRIQTPVFIDVQLAVFVQILEGVAVVLKDGHAGIRGITQSRSALLCYPDPAVFHGFFRPFRVFSRKCGSAERQDQAQT